MARGTRVVVLLAVVAVVAAACTSGTPPPPPRPRQPGGGTLRVGLLSGDGSVSQYCPMLLCGRTFDPQSTTFVDVFELNRCCFMRTLLSYRGTSVADGGTVLVPDLARALPSISADGLTWTFRLRTGVRYAPPMAEREIVAADFIRSFERTFTKASAAIPWANGGTIGGYWTDSYLADVIAGVHEFTDGKAEHVSGLEAPDPHTLVIHLTQPTGDLGYRLALTEMGPIPSNPAHPDDPLGVAQGHDFDYGDVMVSSGPYMFEGADELTYSLPPEDQLPPLGDGFDRAVLVRNPSWTPRSDPVRKALPDRIELTTVATPEQAERAVRDGTVDVVLNWAANATTTERWLADPQLRERTILAPADGMHFVSLNVAVPPFDDLHVRRAMSLAVDRTSIASVLEDTPDAYREKGFTHLALDSYEDDLLLSYAPAGVEPAGNLSAARDEMALSRYDTNGDGRCDAPACSGAKLVVRASDPARVRAALALVATFRQLGLHLSLDRQSDDEFFNSYAAPAAHVALRVDTWFKDFPSGSTFLRTLLRTGVVPGSNLTMVGATPAQLRKYGYTVSSVPSVDDRMDACTAAVFEAQTRCWAQLDQYLSEQLVPWIPLAQEELGWLVSSRVAHIDIDASVSIPVPALDNVRLRPGPTPTGPNPSTSAPVPPSPAIPDGVYRVTITTDDIARMGGPKGDAEDAGTYTIVLKSGRFMWHQLGTGQIFNPIAVGRLVATRGGVSFHEEQPYYNAVPFSDLTWRADGESLAFGLKTCTGPAATDPSFCGFQKALFTAHPWERVTKVSGGPF